MTFFWLSFQCFLFFILYWVLGYAQEIVLEETGATTPAAATTCPDHEVSRFAPPNPSSPQPAERLGGADPRYVPRRHAQGRHFLASGCCRSGLSKRLTLPSTARHSRLDGRRPKALASLFSVSLPFAPRLGHNQQTPTVLRSNL